MNRDEKIKELYRQFRELFGVEPAVCRKIGDSAGNRLYFRMVGSFLPSQDVDCLGVSGTNLAENRAFCNLGKVMLDNGINVPAIYSIGESGLTYLCEDLGDTSLYDIIKNSDSENDICNVIERTLCDLIDIQRLDKRMWEGYVMFSAFDRRQIMWDLNYFKYEYLKPCLGEFDEDLLENDFENFSNSLISVPKKYWGFMYRDCQSRNVMIKGDTPYWIDFQAGRYGPSIYDAISFLWQARAGFSEEFRFSQLEKYIKRYCKEVDGDVSEMSAGIDDFLLFRTLQVLGAYGFRGLIERKAKFVESIPGALSNLKDLLERGILCKYPELERCCRLLVADNRFIKDDYVGLTLEIFSFSYKKGYPDDFSGNGGGYMFDCRGLHNPGRYAEYKSLTGRDAAVVDFLKRYEEVGKFIEDALAIVSISIDTYIRRGFRKLQIGFGCTGGQHRSVYCAENMARMLHEKYPQCRILLIHREQNISEQIGGE